MKSDHGGDRTPDQNEISVLRQKSDQIKDRTADENKNSLFGHENSDSRIQSRNLWNKRRALYHVDYGDILEESSGVINRTPFSEQTQNPLGNDRRRSEDQELVASPTTPEADEPGLWRKNAAVLRKEASVVVLYFTAVGVSGLLAMMMIAAMMHAAYLAVSGARRLRLKLQTYPPWEWLWAMWNRWFWSNLSCAVTTDIFSASVMTPPLVMATLFIARYVSRVVSCQLPNVILPPVMWGCQLVTTFGRSPWMWWSTLLLLGCAIGIPVPTASAFTMKTSSLACLAIPAVASTTWTNRGELSSEIMAARPATKYSACTVEIYNVPEMKWQEVLLDTGAARTSMPLEYLWHTIRKHGTKTLKNLNLISATGAVHSASEETTLEFRFTIGGPTHKMPTLVGGVGSLPMLGANFWGKAGVNIDFPSRTVTEGKEVVPFRATT